MVVRETFSELGLGGDYLVQLKKITIGSRAYTVTSEGHIYRDNGKELVRRKDKYGYEYIIIRNSGIKFKHFVHRLVAEAFIPNPNILPQVNHIDGDKTNNHIGNLEWVTNSENQMHSRYVLGNMTGFRDTPVVCIETGERFVSTRDAWRKTGVSYSHISECARGKRKSAGGFHWKGCD